MTVAIVLLRDERGDFVMHADGCSDIRRTLSRTPVSYQPRGGAAPRYSGATLVDAIVAADTDMASWFCQKPYETDPDDLAWATGRGVNWAPCFGRLLKAEHIGFDPDTARPSRQDPKAAGRTGGR